MYTFQTISRTGSRSASRPDSHLTIRDEEDEDRTASQRSFSSETTAGFDTDLEIEGT